MGEKSAIEWTQNTWNPWQGCHKVSPGCKFCYMYRDKERYGQDPKTVVRSKPLTFNAPLKWKEPALVFTCSWSDWFVEEADAWRPEAWDIIRRTPHLTYQILTKRPERIAGHLPSDWGKGYSNVWLGTSVESQKYVKERIPELLSIPAKVRFLSCEPLLGPLDLERFVGTWDCGRCGWRGFYRYKCPDCGELDEPGGAIGEVSSSVEPLPSISWIITGGESGAKDKIRPADLAWFRSIRDQCQAAGIAYFHKQHGGSTKINGIWGGRELDGRTWDKMPTTTTAEILA